MKRNVFIIVTSLAVGLLVSILLGLLTDDLWFQKVNQHEFNADRAFRDVEYQVNLGPRTPGSPAHSQTVTWIVEELQKSGWQVEIQETELMGHPIRNVVARWGEGRPWVIVGAHYDSRIAADQDVSVERRAEAVPGANDGASGVAVLLELGRVLPFNLEQARDSARAAQVWLVFFDAEDNGHLPGWDWILGSQAFVASLSELPDSAVVVDMVGDADLKIVQEQYSDPALAFEIWQHAAKLGYEDYFVSKVRSPILDDHVPFLNAGVPAVDVIDLSYPFWHTTQDTIDKVSEDSLRIVGETLISWFTQP